MRKTFGVFFRFLIHYKWAFLAFLFSLTLLGVINSINPYFYKLFVDALPTHDYGVLFKLLLWYVGVRALEVVFDLIVYLLGDVVLLQAARDAREKVFKKIQDLDFAYHLTKSSGSLISVFKRGDLAYFGLFHNLNVIFRILIHLVVMLAMFSFIDTKIMILMGISFVLSLIFSKYLLEYNMRMRKTFNKNEDKISAVIVDNLINYETVKYFGKEEKEQKRLRDVFVPWLKNLWGYANSFRLIDVVLGSLSVLGLFVMLYVALKSYVQNDIRLSDFILILGFVSSFYYRFFDAVYRMRDVVKSYSDIDEYFSILDLDTQVKDPKNPKCVKSIKGEIVFENVSFSYKEGQENALLNFSLKIRAGQSVALVGKSGAGKTTAVKLLLRFFDVNKGKITVDSTDIRDFAKHDLRSFIGVVPQEPVMFNNTIAYNIGYGADNPLQKEIEAAAKMAYLHDFILTLPKGYKTNVGERGVKLSGGQKQRLAIARMILSNPDIIIFDEATSQLDSESEKYIQEAFWKASKNKTTIIIAHRLSTVMRADKIVVMDDGHIVEFGSHAELVMKEDGLYRRFWDLQVENVLS